MLIQLEHIIYCIMLLNLHFVLSYQYLSGIVHDLISYLLHFLWEVQFGREASTFLHPLDQTLYNHTIYLQPLHVCADLPTHTLRVRITHKGAFSCSHAQTYNSHAQTAILSPGRGITVTPINTMPVVINKPNIQTFGISAQGR